MTPFDDRRDAGRRLANRLLHLADADTVVLALPRGGVPVAYEVAMRLRAPLDVLVVRKLGVPGYEELAMGAIASGGLRVLNEHVIHQLGIPPDAIERAAQRESLELARRERAYRGDRLPVPVTGRTAILVDDGLATGASLRAAAEGLRQRAPERIIGAVPVGAPETCAQLGRIVDEMICLAQPVDFGGVGRWYHDFRQTSDEEVRRLLDAARQNERTTHAQP